MENLLKIYGAQLGQEALTDYIVDVFYNIRDNENEILEKITTDCNYFHGENPQNLATTYNEIIEIIDNHIDSQ